MARIRHIAIATQDLDKTARFYMEGLGLKEVGRVDSKTAVGYYLTDGHVNVAILKWKSEDPAVTEARWALCLQVQRQRQLRASDITDPQAIADLVATLPERFRQDAALFYYPYGGDIAAGSDTSGVAAAAAGERLNAFYRDECGIGPLPGD